MQRIELGKRMTQMEVAEPAPNYKKVWVKLTKEAAQELCCEMAGLATKRQVEIQINGEHCSLNFHLTEEEPG